MRGVGLIAFSEMNLNAFLCYSCDNKLAKLGDTRNESFCRSNAIASLFSSLHRRIVARCLAQQDNIVAR